MSTKKPLKIIDANVSLLEVEVKAMIALVEQRLRKDSNSIPDIKGLCKVHDKLENALKVFPKPF